MKTNDIIKYCVYCTASVLVGIGYNISHTATANNNRGQEKLLTVPYSFLQYDEQIILFLKDIEKSLRSIDMVSYVRIVNNIDSLIELKLKIQGHGGTLSDRTVAYRKIQKCKESMKRCSVLMESGHVQKNNHTLYLPSSHTYKTQSFSPREIIRVQSTCKKIVYILDSYLKAIISLTCDGRIKC
jgi:hypothetical protein